MGKKRTRSGSYSGGLRTIISGTSAMARLMKNGYSDYSNKKARLGRAIRSATARARLQLKTKKQRRFSRASRAGHKRPFNVVRGRYRRVSRRFQRNVLRSLTNPIVFETTDPTSSTSTVDTQNIIVPGKILLNNSAIASGYTPTIYGDLSFMAQRSNAILNFSPATPELHPTGRYCIARAVQRIEVINACQQLVKMQVYLCKVRKDTPEEIGYTNNSTYTSGFLTTGYANNYNAFPGSTTAPDATDPNVTLFQNPNFCAKVKILKVQDVYLVPGEQKDFNITYNRPRYIANELALNSTVKYLGGSLFYVFRHWGSVANELNTGKVCYATSKLNFVTKRRYEFYPMVDTHSYINQTNNFQTVTPANVQIINPDTDAVMTIGAA